MTNDPTQPARRPTTGLAWGIATHAGRVRDQIEDTGHASPRLFIVADGMGGHQAGEVASELTVTALVLGLVNVGDSRTYLHRHNRLRQVTTDHSFVQELVEQDQITAHRTT